MHLKQLKLAGFKSFVDPSVIEFPTRCTIDKHFYPYIIWSRSNLEYFI